MGGLVALAFAAGRFAAGGADPGPTLAVAALAAILAGTGAVTIMRAHPAAARQPIWLSGIVPAAAAAVLGLGLAQLPIGVPWWLGLGGAAGLWILVVLAEYVSLDPEEGRRPLAALGLSLLTYILVLVLFAALVTAGARAAFSSTLSGLLAGFLGLRLFVLDPRADVGRAALYALVVGLFAAEVLWALSYWRINPITAAAVGLALFYVSAGLLAAQLQGRLRRRLWLEYGIAGLLALLVVLLGSN